MGSFKSWAGAALFALLCASPAQKASAYGFLNQGFTQNPVVRSDFLGSAIGTASSPLQISGCHFGQVPCPTVRSVYPQSNYFTQNYPANCVPGFTCPNWWTLIMNNEPREANGNSGPPDQSLPRFWPGGGGIMGFSTLFGNDNFAGDTYWRAHLVLSTYPVNPVAGGIPYLAFGSFSNHGNGGTIGALNPSAGVPAIVKFDSRLWGSQLPQWEGSPQQSATITSWFTVIASWGTYPKMIQIALYHKAYNGSDPTNPDPYLGGPPPQNSRVKHDWRYLQSGLYPGFEYISLTAEEMASYCGFSVPSLVANVDVHYSINLQSLFTCMKNHNLFIEPMPTTANIPITSIVWANEATCHNGYIWTDVHNMSMSTTASAPAGVDGDIEMSMEPVGEGQFGFATDAIRNDLQLEATYAAPQN